MSETPDEAPPPYTAGSNPGQFTSTPISTQPLPPITAAPIAVIQMPPSALAADDNLMMSLIVCTVCACWPISIVAIYWSWMSMEAKKRGDYQQAAAYGITAKRYNVIAVLTGTIVLAVTTIFTGIWFYVFLGHDRD